MQLKHKLLITMISLTGVCTFAEPAPPAPFKAGTYRLVEGDSKYCPQGRTEVTVSNGAIHFGPHLFIGYVDGLTKNSDSDPFTNLAVGYYFETKVDSKPGETTILNVENKKIEDPRSKKNGASLHVMTQIAVIQKNKITFNFKQVGEVVPNDGETLTYHCTWAR